jgi:hypothetical protein
MAAKVDDTQRAWLTIVLHSTLLILSALYILLGFVRGVSNLKESLHAIQFWVGVVTFPFWMFVLVFDILVLVKVRRRELDADLAS